MRGGGGGEGEGALGNSVRPLQGGGCTVHNLRCLSLGAGRGKNVTSQKRKRIRNRIAFLRFSTKALEVDDALEFMNPR